MPPGLSWISRADAARLVAQLHTPVGGVPDKFPNARAVADSIAAPAASSPPAPAAPSVAPRVKLPELVLPEGGILERVRAFCEWAQQCYGADSVFLADEHGLMVFGVHASPEYVAVMAPLLSAMERMRSTLNTEASRGAVTLRAGEVLSFAEAETSFGRFCLGLLSGVLLDDNSLIGLQEALVKTLQEMQ
ncbi:MAG: hypothetical protein R3B13_28215 [Polyangiaceae bacterium]